jgi:type VI secretion system protein ImpJ
MNNFSPVAWTEGMFLRPQHFQQSDKHLANVIKDLLNANVNNAWGVVDLSIDVSLLNTGQFCLDGLKAVMPDLTPISFLDNTLTPDALIVGKDVVDQLVYLAIPAYRSNSVNVSSIDDSQVTRFKLEDLTVSDDCLGRESEEIIQIAKFNSRLMLSSEDVSGYVVMPIARIVEVSSEGAIRLDGKYIPPHLNIGACKPVFGIVREISALIRQRAENIAGRLSQGYAGSTSVSDFIMLQTLNKYDAIFKSLLSVENIHPYSFYSRLIELSGELATFSSSDKLAPVLPKYDHLNLMFVFSEVNNFLYQSLSQVIEQTATEIKLEKSKFGISFGALKDKDLLRSGQFILAVKASVPHEELRRSLPSQIKIGSVETIRNLVNNQLPGISISTLPTAPRQVPYHAGYHYFELNKHGEQWDGLFKSGGVALHLSGNYPDLHITLWAVRA